MDARNEVVLHGPVVGEVNIKATQGGPLCVINVNTDPDKQNKNAFEDHRVVCWNDLAEQVHKTIRDKDWVLVEGRMQTRTWKNREGNWMRTTEVVASKVSLVQRGYLAGPHEEEPGQEEPKSGVADDTDLPF